MDRKKIIEDKDLEKTIKKHIKVVHMKDIAKFSVGNYGNNVFDSVLNSPVDADKTDYILRDNLHCGFPVALDINTITEILEKDADFGCIIKAEGLSFVEQLLIGRYHLITKIHQNKINRLGNYLMALSLRNAIIKIGIKKAIGEIDNIFNMNDYDLYYFLKEQLDEDFTPLSDFFMGKVTLKEVYSFDYSILSPMDRFNASIISSRKHLLPKISEKLRKETKVERIFIDVNQAKLPNLNLWVCDQSGQRIPIIDTPMIHGIINTSLSWLQVAIYSFEKQKINFDKEEILNLYSKLEPKIREKFEYNLERFGGDENAYYLFLLTECLLNTTTQSLHEKEITPEDLLVITCKAIYQILEDKFNESHLFIDGSSNFVELIKIIQKEESVFSPLVEKGIMLRKYALGSKKKKVISSEIFTDLEKLVNFGLLYRKQEVVKFQKFFNKKQQTRISGWGRGYFQKNLECSNEVVKLYNRVYQCLEAYIKDDEEIIKNYLETSEIQKDNKIQKKREKIRAKTRFRISR